MSRKEQLRAQANRYGKRATLKGDPDWALFATGYEDGYKAAMRDMRKLVKQCYVDTAHHESPGKRIETRNHCVRVRTEQFLKPIR